MAGQLGDACRTSRLSGLMSGVQGGNDRSTGVGANRLRATSLVVAVAAVSAMVLVGGCDGQPSRPSSHSRPTAPSSAGAAAPAPVRAVQPARAQSGEPVRGIAAARRYPDPISYAAAGDGSFLLGYQWKDGCYYRRVFRDGEVTGWFGHRGTGCPSLWGDATGFLGLDSADPMSHSARSSHHSRYRSPGRGVRTPRALTAHC